jgi:tetratricopeptide (TPR) repeat protein
MEKRERAKNLADKMKLCQSEVEKLFLVAADKIGHSQELWPQYPASGYFIDFAIVDKKIAIEIDGHDYHKTIEQRTHDSKRDRDLDLDGWRILRFTGSEIRRDAEGCAKRATIEEFSNTISTRKKTRYERFCELYQIAKTIDDITSSDGSYDDKSLQIAAQETQNMHDHALILMKQGKFEDSIKCLKELISTNPLFISAYNNIGCSLCELGQNEEAIKYFEIVLRQNPLNEMAWINKGHALNELGRYEDAISCFNKSLCIRSNSVSALNHKGIALAKLGKIGESFACFDTIFKINPKLPSNAPVWNNKGDVFLTIKQYTDALDCYAKSIKLDDSNKITWHNKGKTHYLMHQFREANDCYDSAIQLDPYYEDAWYNKGKALVPFQIDFS